MINVTNAGDLRAAYLQTFDSFSLVPSDIVESSEGRVNARYARELLATLVQAKLVGIEDVNGEGDVWQVIDPGTYDNATREEAEARIDAWLGGTKSAEVQTPKSHTSSSGGSRLKVKNESGTCRCGCGEPTKSNYRPGHDARHAGMIGRAIAAGEGADRITELPSPALQAKARRIAELAVEKTEKKDKEIEEPITTHEHGIVKVGKTEYIAERDSDGTVFYLLLSGDKKIASKTAAKSFTVG